MKGVPLHWWQFGGTTVIFFFLWTVICCRNTKYIDPVPTSCMWNQTVLRYNPFSFLFQIIQIMFDCCYCTFSLSLNLILHDCPGFTASLPSLFVFFLLFYFILQLLPAILLSFWISPPSILDLLACFLCPILLSFLSPLYASPSLLCPSPIPASPLQPGYIRDLVSYAVCPLGA